MEYKMGTAPAEWKPALRVCRCCLSEGCYKDISTEYYWLGEKEMYSQMLKECFDLTISLSEAAGSSRLICEVCITRLRDASNFKKQVIKSEKRFAEHLHSGASLSVAEVQETPVLLDIKVEGVKDEAAISDDEPVDDDIGDPDYDESDDLPLKFEVQKKESMTELSFGDEIPALNTSETTIRKVSSRTKEKSALKKLKLNKKELTIKPVKAGTSKKKDKQAKAKVKAVKPGTKKGLAKSQTVGEIRQVRELKADVSARTLRRRRRANNELPEESEKRISKTMMRRNAMTILENSTAFAFRWWRNAFYCSYCDCRFVDVTPLREHVRLNHIRERPTKKIFSKLTENNMVKIDTASLACRICGLSIPDLEKLKSHLVSEHDKNIKAGYSDGVLPFELDRATHICQKCREEFVNFSKLNEHMNSHYQNYICDTCGKAFISKSRFRTHVQSHETGSFVCSECCETFPTRAARMCHKFRVHRQGVRYACPRCPEIFTTYYNRSRHLVTAHAEQGARYPCSVCDKVFEASCKRAVHMRSAHLPAERRHACAECDWRFNTASQLKKHAQTHAAVARADAVPREQAIYHADPVFPS